MNDNSLVLRIVAVGGALILVVGIFWITKHNDNDNKDTSSQATTASVSEDWIIESFKFDVDTDGDGLYDWEEYLWGTKLDNPDTDGDGTPDGEEISLGRDPRIAGPDDKQKQEDLPTYTREDRQNLTESRSFLKDYFDGLLALRQQGDVTQDSFDLMITELANKYLSNPKISREYTLTSIQVLPDESEAAARIYINNLGRLVKEYESLLSAKDVLGVLNVFAIDKSDQTYSEIVSLVQSYNNALESLSSIITPSNFSAEHVSMLNGISTMQKSLIAMYDSSESDPLASIMELSSFRAGLLLFATSAEEIKNQAIQMKIQLSSNDPGRNFLNQ